MTLTYQDAEKQISQNDPSLQYEQSISLLKEMVWEKLSRHTVEEALESWLDSLSKLTAANYRSGIRKLIEFGYVFPKSSLQAFALVNHEAILDNIKSIEVWSECTRQARAACYISFTGFLNRRYQGIIKKAIPSKEGASKTFFKVHEKIKTKAMTQSQWVEFINNIGNPRDKMIAKMVLQGGKRINEVLTLQFEQIDWEKNEITFLQSKTKGLLKETVITYPKHFMEELFQHIGERRGLVFVSRSGKKVTLIQIAKSFNRAGLKAKIPFKVTPHVLRASTVTFLKQQGFPDSDIMRVTGHSSAEMVFAYDKSSRADNASKKVCLIN